MEIARVSATLPFATLEALEVGFAERVTAGAIFFAAAHITAAEPVDVGARIEVSATLDDGTPAFVVVGVVAWQYREGSVPTGREAGTGVVITEVATGTGAVHRMAARSGAGGRVRVPGARVTQRLSLPTRGLHGLVLCQPGSKPDAASQVDVGDLANALVGELDSEPDGLPVRDLASPNSGLDNLGADDADDADDAEADEGDDVAVPRTEAPFGQLLTSVLSEPTIAFGDDDEPQADRAAILEAALRNAGFDTDGIDGPTLDGVDGSHSDSADIGSATDFARVRPPVDSAVGSDLSALSELDVPSGEQPLFEEAGADEDDDPDGSTLPRPPITVDTAPGLMLDLSGVEAFPEAPPSPPGKPFEAQSTDVDLLGLISAADVVAVDAGSIDAPTGELQLPPQTDGEELPSVEADLLDVGEWPAIGDDGATAAWPSLATELFSNRRLPESVPWPEWSDLLDARTMGVSFSMSKRGQGGIEFFSWPLTGTKRYSGVGQGDVSDPRRQRTSIVPIADELDDLSLDDGEDGDVFSQPTTPPVVSGSSDDPFVSQGTDPRLNVEGLVARHVRASHKDVAEDTAIFDDALGLDLDMGDDPDATRDEMMLPKKPVANTNATGNVFADPISGTDSGEGVSSSSEPDALPGVADASPDASPGSPGASSGSSEAAPGSSGASPGSFSAGSPDASSGSGPLDDPDSPSASSVSEEPRTG